MKSIRYCLTAAEIEEALLCLDFRLEGRFKRWNVGILSLLGSILLLQYLRYPDKFYFALGGMAIISLLLGILYIPLLGRKNRALQMGKKEGEYQFSFSDTIVIAGDNLEIPFLNNKALLLDSENVLTLRIQKDVFCIPKREIDEKFVQALKTVVKNHEGKIYNVGTHGRVIRHGEKLNR